MSYLRQSKTSEHKQQKDAEQISSERVNRPIATDPILSILGLQHTAGNQAVTHLLQQSQRSPNLADDVPPIVYNVLNSPGQPLDAGTRAAMEAPIGHGFGHVLIHTDAQAAESARSMNSLAYTLGRDIVFGTGQYVPGTNAGQRLLAHELIHTLQQGRSLVKPAAFAIRPSADLAEREAEHLSSNFHAPVLPGKQYSLSPLLRVTHSISPAIQRQMATQGASPPAQTQPETNEKNIEQDLETDVQFIVKKLNKSYYFDSDEQEVLAILNRRAAVPNPPRATQRPGSRYLERLLMKLQQKSKDVGILTTQQSSYYSLLFNRSSRLDELRGIRDTYAPLYARYEGEQETSFGGVLWEGVKSGEVRDQIFAYGKGLGKGFYAGTKGFVVGTYQMVRHPVETAKGLYHAAKNYRQIKENVKKLGKEYWAMAAKDPVKFAEMTGEITGQVEALIATPKIGKAGGGLLKAGVAKLAPSVGRMARVSLAAAMLGTGRVVPRISGGTYFAKGVTTVARGVEASGQTAEEVTQMAQQVTQATQEVTQITQAAQETTQAVQGTAQLAQEVPQAIGDISQVTQEASQVADDLSTLEQETTQAAQTAESTASSVTTTGEEAASTLSSTTSSSTTGTAKQATQATADADTAQKAVADLQKAKTSGMSIESKIGQEAGRTAEKVWGDVLVTTEKNTKNYVVSFLDPISYEQKTVTVIPDFMPTGKYNAEGLFASATEDSEALLIADSKYTMAKDIIAIDDQIRGMLVLAKKNNVPFVFLVKQGGGISSGIEKFAKALGATYKVVEDTWGLIR